MKNWLYHFTFSGAGVNVEAFNDQGSSSFVNVFLEARKSAAKKADQKMFDEALDEQMTILHSNTLHYNVRKGHLR